MSEIPEVQEIYEISSEEQELINQMLEPIVEPIPIPVVAQPILESVINDESDEQIEIETANLSIDNEIPIWEPEYWLLNNITDSEVKMATYKVVSQIKEIFGDQYDIVHSNINTNDIVIDVNFKYPEINLIDIDTTVKIGTIYDLVIKCKIIIYENMMEIYYENFGRLTLDYYEYQTGYLHPHMNSSEADNWESNFCLPPDLPKKVKFTGNELELAIAYIKMFPTYVNMNSLYSNPSNPVNFKNSFNTNKKFNLGIDPIPITELNSHNYCVINSISSYRVDRITDNSFWKQFIITNFKLSRDGLGYYRCHPNINYESEHTKNFIKLIYEYIKNKQGNYTIMARMLYLDGGDIKYRFTTSSNNRLRTIPNELNTFKFRGEMITCQIINIPDNIPNQEEEFNMDDIRFTPSFINVLTKNINDNINFTLNII